MEENKYPVWLADKLLNCTLDWAASTKTSMQELLATITLHDSYWYNTLLGAENEWLVVINLDAVWNKAFCHNLKDWPFLIIRFQRVFCSFQVFSEYDGNYRTISEAEVTTLNGRAFAEWLDFTKLADLLPVDILQNMQAASGLSRTEISTVYSGVLSLVHTPVVEILLYSEQGIRLAINLVNESERKA